MTARVWTARELSLALRLRDVQALAYVRRACIAGGTVRSWAEALGVPPRTLQRWLTLPELASVPRRTRGRPPRPRKCTE